MIRGIKRKVPEWKKRRKKSLEKERLKKFENYRCVVCGKPTKYHHSFCDKHYHLQKKLS